VVIDGREVDNMDTAVVVYDNPLDNVEDLAHIFFKRCLEANIVPYVVTKKTVFKWQEGFWQKMKAVFDKDYKDHFLKAGLLDGTGKDLLHLISDAATMQIIRWTGGGFGMACHNYDEEDHEKNRRHEEGQGHEGEAREHHREGEARSSSGVQWSQAEDTRRSHRSNLDEIKDGQDREQGSVTARQEKFRQQPIEKSRFADDDLWFAGCNLSSPCFQMHGGRPRSNGSVR